mmetsp:Transcript_558/g.947  ORF Transcript_558/g.947 Transcript_558/m.947 type:complete len:243 (+) Transcript_558:193-921(+)
MNKSNRAIQQVKEAFDSVLERLWHDLDSEALPRVVDYEPAAGQNLRTHGPRGPLGQVELLCVDGPGRLSLERLAAHLQPPKNEVVRLDFAAAQSRDSRPGLEASTEAEVPHRIIRQNARCLAGSDVEHEHLPALAAAQAVVCGPDVGLEVRDILEESEVREVHRRFPLRRHGFVRLRVPQRQSGLFAEDFGHVARDHCSAEEIVPQNASHLVVLQQPRKVHHGEERVRDRHRPNLHVLSLSH